MLCLAVFQQAEKGLVQVWPLTPFQVGGLIKHVEPREPVTRDIAA
mgnify:CR=1 FL=1